MNHKHNVKLSNTSISPKSPEGQISNFVHRTLIKVLHIDDDSNQLLFTKIFLEECDSKLSVESISHPTKVVDILSSKEFDCIVSDYQMDEMDGIALTKKVRKASNVPIIIYTGRGSEEVEAVARAAGADGYLQKETDPSHYKVLYSLILGLVHLN
jgi:CheY-like chemotaxis protein